jgi:methionine biosynthesis protein MetW
MINDFKYKDLAWEKTDPKEIVYKLINNNSKILELGCWAGRLGWKLKKEKKCFVVGVDINKKAVEIAKSRLDKVFLIDLNTPFLLNDIFIKNKFDYIIATEVLEHLVNPEDLLKYLREKCKNTRLIISLPNVANYKVRFNLVLRGKFDYEQQGILDNSHLRFYTLKSAKKMFNDCGFKINKVFFTRAKIFQTLFAEQFIFIIE